MSKSNPGNYASQPRDFDTIAVPAKGLLIMSPHTNYFDDFFFF
jgi:hypothetical protein